MPRETIHYGRDFANVKVRATDDLSGYTYELNAGEAHVRVASDELKRADVEFSNKPHLHLEWQRPVDALALPVGEEPKGSVQVSISLNPTEMKHVIDHIAEHPEDLEAFSIFRTESLTRYEINNLIRTLKRARDAAYGGDE